MLLPLSWLREYVHKLPPVAELSDLLLRHGIEVESVQHPGELLKGVVVAEVLSLKPHPDADRLQIATVRLDSKAQPVEIVCGAPNIAVGQKVPAALVGTALPTGVTIERRPIRGVSSEGMLCALDELGLGSDHRGLFVLDPKAKVGTPLAEVLGLDQPVLDLSLPANRADLLSLRGLAREISVIIHRSTTIPVTSAESPSRLSGWKVKTDQRLAAMMSIRLIDSVTMNASPSWLVGRLHAAGIRSVNLVVDVTNYVMLETGHPLHAYDVAKLNGKSLTVRLAKTGEKLVTLDSQERQLESEDIIISDPKGVVGLAGVMGGKATEVSETTTAILLEAGVFDGTMIRRTARRFGLQSEASKRFEHGVTSEGAQLALARATQLLLELAGAKDQGQVTTGKVVTPRRSIIFSLETVSERLGQRIPPKKSQTLLTALGFVQDGERWQVPVWRGDVHYPEDLIDEVGRIIGYDHLPLELPVGGMTLVPSSPLLGFKERVRDALAMFGLTEIISHATYGQREAETVGGQHSIIANPLDQTQHALRRSLQPAIMRAITQAVDAGQDAQVFEMSRVFQPSDKPLPDWQPWKIGIGIGYKRPAEEPQEWMMLGLLTELQRILNLRHSPTFTLNATQLKGRTVTCLELDLAELYALSSPQLYRPNPTTPVIERDMNLNVPDNETFATLKKKITALALPLLREYSVTHVRQEDRHRQVTIRFIFQDPHGTLQKDAVDQMEQAIRQALGA